MKNEVLPSSALPILTEAIKHVIGLGMWTLTRVESNVEGAIFLLQTDKGVKYLLNNEGDVIKETDETDKIDEINGVMFEDYVIDFPEIEKIFQKSC